MRKKKEERKEKRKGERNAKRKGEKNEKWEKETNEKEGRKKRRKEDKKTKRKKDRSEEEERRERGKEEKRAKREEERREERKGEKKNRGGGRSGAGGGGAGRSGAGRGGAEPPPAELRRSAAGRDAVFYLIGHSGRTFLAQTQGRGHISQHCIHVHESQAAPGGGERQRDAESGVMRSGAERPGEHRGEGGRRRRMGGEEGPCSQQAEPGRAEGVGSVYIYIDPRHIYMEKPFNAELGGPQ